MSDSVPSIPPSSDSSEVAETIRARTPARLLVGHAGPAYRTATQLELRQDHAAALDAVHAELDLERDFSGEFLSRWALFEVRTQAETKETFLLRPDLGRRLPEAARVEVARLCPSGADL